MPLEEVLVTPLRPERFEEVLTPDALAEFQRTVARAHELLGSRTIWNVTRRRSEAAWRRCCAR